MQQSGREGHPISSVSKELFRNEAVGWWRSSALRPVRSLIVPHGERSSVPLLPLFYGPLWQQIIFPMTSPSSWRNTWFRFLLVLPILSSTVLGEMRGRGFRRWWVSGLTMFFWSGKFDGDQSKACCKELTSLCLLPIHPAHGEAHSGARQHARAATSGTEHKQSLMQTSPHLSFSTRVKDKNPPWWHLQRVALHAKSVRATQSQCNGNSEPLLTLAARQESQVSWCLCLSSCPVRVWCSRDAVPAFARRS